MISVRTDLAIEAKQAYTEENKRELDGIRVDAVSNVIMRRRKNFKLNLPIIYKRGWQN